MGKRKGTGLSGLSKFILQSFKSEAALDVSGINSSLDQRPTKKRKANDSKGIDSNSFNSSQWIQKYDSAGLVPHYTELSQVPEHLRKYFAQRTRYFSLYSQPPGCLLDEEGWYSVTPELIADQIAERCRCDTVLDAFCGVGGNAIAFAKTCQRVIALDTSPIRLSLARHNAQIYGVADRIEFILADYISFANSYSSRHSSPSQASHNSRKIDVVFLSPPWGGPSYLSGTDNPSQASDRAGNEDENTTHPIFSLSSVKPIHGAELFNLSRKITKNLAYYLPRNTNLEEVSNLVNESGAGYAELTSGDKEKIEIEEEWMGNKLKALTCYFGGLAANQPDLF